MSRFQNLDLMESLIMSSQRTYSRKTLESTKMLEITTQMYKAIGEQREVMGEDKTITK